MTDVTFLLGDELKRRLVEREFATVGVAASWYARAAGLVGRVNDAPFCGHAPGTVLLRGFGVEGDRATFHFVRRELPWNEFLHLEAPYHRAIIDRAGQPAYPAGDFSPLPTDVEPLP